LGAALCPAAVAAVTIEAVSKIAQAEIRSIVTEVPLFYVSK